MLFYRVAYLCRIIYSLTELDLRPEHLQLGKQLV